MKKFIKRNGYPIYDTEDLSKEAKKSFEEN